MPKLPSRRTFARDSAVAPSPIAGSTLSTSSSRSTRSATDADSDSCTSAIELTRRTLSPSARRASGIAVRRACRRSRAATVCRLFFTRWWISRIVASLRQQGLVAAAQVGDVAHEHQRARRVARAGAAAARAPAWPRRGRRDLHAQRVPPASAAVDAGGDLGGVERVGDQPAGRGGERQPDEVAGVAHPVVGRERVGAGVGDEALRVEPDQAVAGARARVGARDGRRGGKVPSATIWQRSDALPR